MAKSPAFQFYAADFLTDTAEMTDQEVGVYIRLLAHQWINGSIPNDPERLCSIARSLLDVWQHISSKFVKGEDGRLRNPRLEETRRIQRENSEKRRIAGSKGGKAKQINSKSSSKHPSKTKAKSMQKCSLSSSSSSSVVNPPYPPALNVDAWEEYEKHRRDNRAKKLRTKSVEQLWAWLVDQGDKNIQEKIIQQTIRNGWTGLFELKGKSNGTHQQDDKPRSAADRIRVANERILNR